MNGTMFEGKVVWITGASSGIGEALAVEFARFGARPVLSGRDTAALERVAARCTGEAGAAQPVIVPFDMSDFGSFSEIVDTVLDRTGGIDLLVNNAGIGQRSTALACKSDDIHKIMDVNFFGPVFLTRALLPFMLGRGSGTVVVISSILGKFHFPGRSVYCASKHAVQGYFSTLRTELHGSGINVSIICPGWIATNFSRNALSELGHNEEKPSRTITGKMNPAHFARKALRAIASGKQETVIGGPEILGIIAGFFFPKLFERILGRWREFTIRSGSAG